jgi:hypothetical protein
MRILSLAVLAASLLSACVSSISVHSRPEGALISSNNQTIGVSPIRFGLDSDLGQSFRKFPDGCYEAPPFSAHWASGAVAKSIPNPVCQGPDGNYRIFISRPANAPDLKKDLDAANQREEVLARKRQARAMNNLAEAEEDNAAAMSFGGWGGPGIGLSF